MMTTTRDFVQFCPIMVQSQLSSNGSHVDSDDLAGNVDRKNYRLASNVSALHVADSRLLDDIWRIE